MRYFSGQLPEGESRCEQKIYPQGRDVHFELTLDAGGEADDIAWAEFVFYLPLAAFQNQRYLADGNEGIYPAEYGAGTLAENLTELQLLPDDQSRR